MSESLPELSKRQEELLALIVRAYTEKAEPVSSKHLVEAYDLNFSSATVRNEMAKLEELGYITAPHTSAGRIPTALGYRHVVKDLLDSDALTLSDRNYIETRFNELPAAIDQWMRQAAKVLARTAHTASLVTPPISAASRFKHLQLISVQGRVVLLIVVLQGGAVHQRMLTLADTIPQGVLSETANHINAICHNLKAHEIRLKSLQFTELEREVAELTAELMDKSVNNLVRIVYRDGLGDIINAFPDNEGAQQVVRVYEERALLDMILGEILHPILEEQHVQVVIAGDGREELSQLSMVLSQYGLPGKMRGMLGVVGPMNINYGRAISAVRHISTMMTDMLVEMYDADSPADDE